MHIGDKKKKKEMKKRKKQAPVIHKPTSLFAAE